MAKNNYDLDEIGDASKRDERLETARRTDDLKPVVIRLDGRAFHTFTKGLDRPYDAALRECFHGTAVNLYGQFNPDIAYCQSDEITLGWLPAWDGNPRSARRDVPFKGVKQKLVSVIAGAASAKFTQLCAGLLPSKFDLENPPCFDARIFQPADVEAMAMNLMWRQEDAYKNAVTMAVGTIVPHKRLHGVSTAKRLRLLQREGIDFEAVYPETFKRGVFFKRTAVLRTLPDEALAKIPEARRPCGPVVRSEIQERPVGRLAGMTPDEMTEALFGG